MQTIIYPKNHLGCRLARWVLSILGWTVVFDGLPAAKGVMVIYPHTSNWDFCIAILAKWSTGLPFRFLAKDSLFKIPFFSRWLRSVGGIPVIRNSSQGYVEHLAEQLMSQDLAWLVITPEGTRQYTPGWRSGFYHLALKAQVPIGLSVIDYQKKKMVMSQFFMPSGIEEDDLVMIRKAYESCSGLYQESASPIVFWTPTSKN
jgi:1-acyl-sn-glycerol-3-phosphate acyltransferase